MPDARKAARRAADKFGVREDVFLRMIQQESGFNPNAHSPAGAQGIAQFMPATAKAYGVDLNDGRITDDLEGAARYVRDNLKRTGGNYHQALSIYNSGRPDTYKDPKFAGGQTYNYVRNIMSGVTGHGPRGKGSTGAGGYRTETDTVPGVDRSQQRQMLKFAYLQDRGNPDALLSLAAGLQKAQDTPDKTKTRRVKVRAASTRGAVRGRPNAQGDPGQLKELFYNGPGGVNVDEGHKVGKGFVSGHTDHAHGAFSSHKKAVAAGRLARDMGLNVRELAPFDHVDPVHAPNSYHGDPNRPKTQRALDVSGDPRKVAAWTHEVGRRFGVGR